MSQSPLDYATPRQDPRRPVDWPRLVLRGIAATVVVVCALVFALYAFNGLRIALRSAYYVEPALKCLTLAMLAAVPTILGGILYVLCDRPRT